MLTNEQLEAIRQRAEKATEGPWINDDAIVKTVAVRERKYGDPESIAETMYDYDNDAEFIAHAREDIPALLAEVERLESKIKLYESLAQEFDYYAIISSKGENDD